MKKLRARHSVALVAILCLFTAGCPRPKSTTVELECSVNSAGVRTCRAKTTIVYLADPAVDIAYYASSSEGVLDLADPWSPDTAQIPSMTIRLIDANGVVSSEQSFALALEQTPRNAVSPIASDLTSYFYVPLSPHDVSSYMTNSSYAGGGIADVEVILDMPVKKNSGYHEPGEYLNHVRWTDPNGVEYVGAFTMTIPGSPDPGCTERTRTC